MDVKLFASQALGRGVLLGKKHSPEILTIAGIAGLVGAGVLAARATLKLESIVDTHRDRVEDLRIRAVTLDKTDEQAVAQHKKDLLYVYSTTTWELTKAYGPAVTLAGVSVFGILAGQNILRKRNLALVGAYKALESTFSEYRKRVVEEYGEEKDRDFVQGVRREKVADENGKKTEVVTVADDKHAASIYGRYFDELCPDWDQNAEYNLIFLKNQQNWANDKLNARGHIFLNEVYDMLGIEHSQVGQVVGWVLSKEGDNFVDFGLFDRVNSKALNHTSSRADNVFFLDFNVDGNILDKI